MWHTLSMNPSTTLLASDLASTLHSRGFVRLGLLALAAVGASSAGAQAIYAATEHAESNGVISVRGDALEMDTEFTLYPYGTDGIRKAGVKLAPTQANGTIAMVRLPVATKSSMYELVAQTGRGKTNSVFLNRPRAVWTDVSEAMPGNVVRLIGRNFRPFSTLTPAVTMTNSATGAKIAGRVSFQDDSNVNFVVPDGTPVGNYTLSINNGLAGDASTDETRLPLTVVAKKSDPFNLGVSWGGEFSEIGAKVYDAKNDSRFSIKAKGDGATDDSAAINSAITQIRNLGGGTLFLPAGIYRVDDIRVTQNIVLKGEGKGRTVLIVGNRFSSTIAPNGGENGVMLWGENAGRTGIADLSIVNMNRNAKPNYVLRTGPSYNMSAKVFMKNVSVALLNGHQVQFNILRKGVIADCDITSTSLNEGALYVTDVHDLQFVRNRIDYRIGRTIMTFNKRVVCEDNKVRIDNAYQTPGSFETGGIESSYTQQMLIARNEVGGYNGVPTKPIMDLEMIGTQASTVVPDYCYVGMVKMASGRLLMPTANWATTAWQAPTYAPLPRMAILITSGKGAGQWRWVSTWSSNAAMVDRPWQITPNATSRFALTQLSCYAQTIINNKLTNSRTAITLYSGGVDCAITGNVAENCGQIYLRGDSRARTENRSNYSVFPVLDVTVMQNRVSAPDGLTAAGITSAAVDVAGTSFGSLVAGVDVRYNDITGSNRPWKYGEAGTNDGLEIASVFYNRQTVDYVNQVGTVAEGNTIARAAKPIMVRGTTIGELINNLVNRQ